MTAPARHPDPEQLTAFAAGDPDVLDPLIIQAHLDVCDACAADVQALDALDTQLAALPEPELPAGLAERLTAAVRAENAAHPPVAPRAAAVFDQPGHAPTGDEQDTHDQAAHGGDRDGHAAPVTPLRPRTAPRFTVRRWMWAAAAIILLAVVFAGQLETLNTGADSSAGAEPPPPSQASTQESSGEAPAAGSPETARGPAATSQDRSGDRERDGADEPAAEQAPGASAPPQTDPPAATQPPSAERDEPQREVAPEVPRTAPADEGDGNDGGDAPPSETTSPGRDDPSDKNVAPAVPPNDDSPSILQDDPCAARAEEDGRQVKDVKRNQGADDSTVVIAEDDDGQRFEYIFPGGDCSVDPEEIKRLPAAAD